MNTGDRIKALRLQKGLTQQELADLSGISLRSIQRIERGEVSPRSHSLKELGKALETDLTELLIQASESASFSNSNKPSKMQNLPFLAQLIRKSSLPLLALSFILASYWGLEKLIPAPSDSGSIAVQTINCGSDTECDIELTKKSPDGKILWQKTFGGTSYDKASSVIQTPDQGYLIVGSTSSFGKGNYDVLLIKVNADGNLVWQQTYGEFFNEYGYSAFSISAGEGFEIEGTQQTCTTENVSNDCKDLVWKFRIDHEGKIQS